MDHGVLKYVLFFSGTACTLLSISLYQLKKEKTAVFFLTLGSFFIFLFGAFLFNFLNPWDERFHAVVAKNMMGDPFKPTLYRDPVVSMEYNWWNIDHVWLHKQPLFLWQMALSMKLFGVNVVALRIPSVILSTLLVACGYRIGSLVSSKRVGYLMGLFILSSQFLFLLVSGYGETDHNDVSFVAYISFSIWAWLEYNRSKKWYWIALIGLFSGFAVLTKWLVGLYVYLIWGIYELFKHRIRFKYMLPLLCSFLLTTLIALPWQVYTNIRFPGVAQREHNYNFQHLIVAVDGHEGSFFYHFEWMNVLFGSFTLLLILPSILFFIKKSRDKKLGWSIVASVILVYLFFSFSATKMPSFTFVLMMPVFLFLSSLSDFIFESIRKPGIHPAFSKAVAGLFMALLLTWRFAPFELSKKHGFFSSPGECAQVFYRDAEIFRNLSLPQNSVLFNVKAHHYIEAMFHTDFPAYNFMPSRIQYEDLVRKNRRIVILKGPFDNIPEYLSKDPDTIILEKETAGCD